MVLAYDQAQRLGTAALAPEHILLRLLKEGSGVAAHVLRNFDVDFQAIFSAVEANTPKPPVMDEPPSTESHLPWWRLFTAWRQFGRPPRMPQTEESKLVVASAMTEARSLNHNYVGTEHLLLGLLRQRDSFAAKLLIAQGLNLDDVRRGTLQVLGHDA